MPVAPDMATLADELASLTAMSPAQLRAEWRRVYRVSPPPLTPELLMRGIAYRLQERAFGGLSRKIVKAIRRLAEQAERSQVDPAGKVAVKLGTRLVRNWNGTTYSVLVTDDGYMLGSQRFASLSHVARTITGAHWSGPRFFGVKGAAGTTGAAARSSIRPARLQPAVAAEITDDRRIAL